MKRQILIAGRRCRSGVLLSMIVVVVAGACSGSHHSSPVAAPHARAATTTLPTPRAAVSSRNIYAAAGANMLSPIARTARFLIYVPESTSSYVDVIDPQTFKVVDRYRSGLNPQHVVPAWDLRTLYVTNDRGNSLTPIDPETGNRAGPNIPVDDPYNMYFTPDGRSAIVVAEAQRRLDFRDPHTFALQRSIHVDCAGIDHIDFSADGSYLIGTCEFSGRLVKVNLPHRTVAGYLDLPGSSPQDIKLDPTGHIFYVADRYLGGVHEIDAATFREVGFIHTGRDAHGLYPSRDGRDLYVSNRHAGTVSVIDFATRTIVATWRLPTGATPDMGGVSADGTVLWLTGRYSSAVYAISTRDGRLLAQIRVPNQPHGASVWPQPGRYSLGHTGITR